VIVIPALDLRQSACVQLAEGSPDRELIRSHDPVAVAIAWRRYGFHHLHVVDLDAITGPGNNIEQVGAIVAATDAEVQIGGGIRTRERIQEALNDGAQRVVIGRRALEDPDWLADMTSLFPGSIIVAADVRDRKVLSRGWTHARAKLVIDVLDDLNGLPLAGIMVSTVQRQEANAAADLPLLEDLAEVAEFPVYAAGSAQSLNDLRALAERGVAVAVVGLPLYSGAIEPRVAAEEFSEAAEFFG
jgi:phosphoribosylformimino-5-aminoimidazole carboxamide ribotide isomerase